MTHLAVSATPLPLTHVGQGTMALAQQVPI